jgi:hypothetical protein
MLYIIDREILHIVRLVTLNLEAPNQDIEQIRMKSTVSSCQKGTRATVVAADRVGESKTKTKTTQTLSLIERCLH